jgi:RNA ligase (TIGR02306 family)
MDTSPEPELRKLALVTTIRSIEPIPDADAIEIAVVGGWNVIVKKGEYSAGDRCVYIEIDAFVPVGAGSPFEFLAARGVKKMVADGNEYTGHVLKTARMRGVYSQGFVLSLAALGDAAADVQLGADVTQLLGIMKWEPPLPSNSGQLAGPFPSHVVQKTDAERVQNLLDSWDDIAGHQAGWIATEKVDGTSLTVARGADGVVTIASRNFAVEGGLYAEAAEQFGLIDLVGPDEAIQAEIYGEGVQANPLKVKGRHIIVFNFSRHHKDLGRDEWPKELLKYAAPVFVDLPFPASPDEAIAQADGVKSLISPALLAEGIVWRTADGATLPCLGRSLWKVISNKWLAKEAKR